MLQTNHYGFETLDQMIAHGKVALEKYITAEPVSYLKKISTKSVFKFNTKLYFYGFTLKNLQAKINKEQSTTGRAIMELAYSIYWGQASNFEKRARNYFVWYHQSAFAESDWEDPIQQEKLMKVYDLGEHLHIPPEKSS